MAPSWAVIGLGKTQKQLFSRAMNDLGTEASASSPKGWTFGRGRELSRSLSSDDQEAVPGCGKSRLGSTLQEGQCEG